jgi:hypothetical protein
VAKVLPPAFYLQAHNKRLKLADRRGKGLRTVSAGESSAENEHFFDCAN